MRRFSWTPSIVPQWRRPECLHRAGPTLVVAAGLIVKPTASALTLKRLSWTCSRGNIRTRSASSASTPRRNVLRTVPGDVASCAAARSVPFYLEDFVERYEVSRYPATAPLAAAHGVSRGIPAQEARGDGTKAPFPGFIEPALATAIEKTPSGSRLPRSAAHRQRGCQRLQAQRARLDQAVQEYHACVGQPGCDRSAY